MSPGPPDRLVAFLEDGRRLGFLGPGDVRPHVEHAEAFAAALVDASGGRPPASLADLGSGGGLPGVVLARLWPSTRVLLVDASHRRCEHLRTVGGRLDLDHVEVAEGRAEELAHRIEYRETFDAVTARSLDTPARTAELACGFLRVGGVAVVSEPPDARAGRWPEAGLAALGFGPARRVAHGGRHFVALPKVDTTPAGVPRPTRRLVKQPAW